MAASGSAAPTTDRDGGSPAKWDQVPAQKPLERGSGQGRFLYFDVSNGCRGDSLVASLLDLGVPEQRLRQGMSGLGLGWVQIEITRQDLGSAVARRLRVTTEDSEFRLTGAEVRQQLEGAELDPGARQAALSIVLRLLAARGEPRGVTPSAVSFEGAEGLRELTHVILAAVCFAYLGAEVWCGPVPLPRAGGEGSQQPASTQEILLCLRGLATAGTGGHVDHVTADGAAIVGAMSVGASHWIESRPLVFGWGASLGQSGEHPALTRVALCEPWPATSGGGRQAEPQQPAEFEVIECNVDDLTGEQAGHTISRLLVAGALDAWATPLTMKKGRPGWVLSALTTVQKCAAIAETMLRETSTLGVRHHRVRRTELPRRMLSVPTRFGLIDVKVAGDLSSGTSKLKPEFDQCAARAEQHSVPVRVVIEEALVQARALALGG